MKNKIIVLILLFAAAAAALAVYRSAAGGRQGAETAVYYCPMHPAYTAPKPGTCPICNMSLVKKDDGAGDAVEKHLHGEHNHEGGADEAAGTSAPRTLTVEELMSMEPGEICLLHKCKMGKCMIAMTEEFARLGKCPHCGEDLGVTISDAVPGGYAGLKLSAEKQQAIGVRTAPVQKRPMTKIIRTVGRIAYDPELYQAQEEYLQALRSLQKAESSAPEIREQAARLIESVKIKLRLLGLNEELIQELEKTGKADRSLLYGDAGESVWLYAPIYEYELPFVKRGARLKAEVPSLPGTAFEGEIRAIDPVLDPVTRSARVRARLENPDGSLKPEMYVNAMIAVALGEKLAVPEEAVFATGERSIVFVAGANGAFEPREVKLGAAAEQYREVLGGLAEGERVVTSGNFLIDSESRLKASLQGAAGGGGAGGHQHG